MYIRLMPLKLEHYQNACLDTGKGFFGLRSTFLCSIIKESLALVQMWIVIYPLFVVSDFVFLKNRKNSFAPFGRDRNFWFCEGGPIPVGDQWATWIRVSAFQICRKNTPEFCVYYSTNYCKRSALALFDCGTELPASNWTWLNDSMKKALIIDDEVDLCMLLSLQLRSLGITNEYVNTIQEAKEKFKANRYEIIFLDLNLKDGSGFDMLSFMSDYPKLQKVIVISAYDNERSKVLECGADYFLPKPFTKKKVAQIIDTI